MADLRRVEPASSARGSPSARSPLFERHRARPGAAALPRGGPGGHQVDQRRGQPDRPHARARSVAEAIGPVSTARALARRRDRRGAGARQHVHHYAAYWLGDLDIKRPDAGLRERPLMGGAWQPRGARRCCPVRRGPAAQRGRVKVYDVDPAARKHRRSASPRSTPSSASAPTRRIEAVARALLDRYSGPGRAVRFPAGEAKIEQARRLHASTRSRRDGVRERFANEPLIAEHLR